jgi:hypothetical protein
MTSVPLGADLTALGSYSARTQRALRVYFSRLRQAAIGRLLPVNAIRGSLFHPGCDVSIQMLIS